MLSLGGTALLFGCATPEQYTAPELPKTHTGLLKTTVSWLSITEASVEIRKIDGEAISRYTRSVKLLPGIHQLEVVCYWDQDGILQPRYTGLEVSVSPDKSYQLFSIPRSSGCEVEVEEFIGGR